MDVALVRRRVSNLLRYRSLNRSIRSANDSTQLDATLKKTKWMELTSDRFHHNFDPGDIVPHDGSGVQGSVGYQGGHPAATAKDAHDPSRDEGGSRRHLRAISFPATFLSSMDF